MTGTARLVALSFCAAIALGGLMLFALGDGGGIGLLMFAAMLLCGIVFERRYGRARPGSASARWQPTGERFVDDESGEPLEVWSDPLTGQRRYVPLGHPPGSVADRR
jgi:hypothetical protein